MKSYTMKLENVCPREVQFDKEDNRIYNVKFTGGCSGNLNAISKLINGMECDKIIDMLQGNKCGLKDTSCADQLTRVLIKIKDTE